MNFNVALRIATETYGKALPPGSLPMYSELEWWWISSIAQSAEHFWGRMLKQHRLSMKFKEMLKEGIAWRIRDEMGHYRQAAMALVEQQEHNIPTLSSLQAATESEAAWSAWINEHLWKVISAVYRGDERARDLFAVLSRPEYIRLPSGWRSITETEREFRESFRTPGPKSSDIILLGKNVIRTFPPIYHIDNRQIDLGNFAIRLLESTTRWLPVEMT